MKKVILSILLFILCVSCTYAIEQNSSLDEFGLIFARNKAGFIGTTNIYNHLENITGKISVNLKGTSTVYDSAGNIVKTYKKSKNRVISYDVNGNILNSYLLDENNNVTAYDSNGNIIASYQYEPYTESVICYSPTRFMLGKYTTDINGKTRQFDQYGNIIQLYYSEGLQAVNTNDGLNGVLNSLWEKGINRLRN